LNKVLFLILTFIATPLFADINEDLINAARIGDVAQVKELILGGADINALDSDGNCVLVLAACNGHLGVVEHLVKVGSSIDVCNRFGHTSLRLFYREGCMHVAVPGRSINTHVIAHCITKYYTNKTLCCDSEKVRAAANYGTLGWILLYANRLQASGGECVCLTEQREGLIEEGLRKSEEIDRLERELEQQRCKSADLIEALNDATIGFAESKKLADCAVVSIDAELQDERRRYEEDVEGYRKSIEDLESKLKEMREQEEIGIEFLRRWAEEIKRSNRELEKRFRRADFALSETESKLVDERGAHIKFIAQKDLEISRINERHAGIIQEDERRHIEKDRLIRELHLQIESMERESAEIEHRNAKMRETLLEKIDELEMAVASLRRQYEGCAYFRREADRDKADAEHVRERAKRKVSNLKHVVEELREKNVELRKQKQAADRAMIEMKRERDELRAELAEAEDNVFKAAKYGEELLKELGRLRSELDSK